MTSRWGRCPVEQQDLRGGGEHEGSRQPSGGQPQGVGGDSVGDSWSILFPLLLAEYIDQVTTKFEVIPLYIDDFLLIY